MKQWLLLLALGIGAGILYSVVQERQQKRVPKEVS